MWFPGNQAETGLQTGQSGEKNRRQKKEEVLIFQPHLTECRVTHELVHLAGYFTRQLRYVFRCIAMAMQRKACLIDTQNPGAILRHLIHDMTRVIPDEPCASGDTGSGSGVRPENPCR